jgi:hypothetical protein
MKENRNIRFTKPFLDYFKRSFNKNKSDISQNKEGHTTTNRTTHRTKSKIQQYTYEYNKKTIFT